MGKIISKIALKIKALSPAFSPILAEMILKKGEEGKGEKMEEIQKDQKDLDRGFRLCKNF